MNTRFYQAADLNLVQIAADVEGIFRSQGYQAQHFGNKDHVAVQVKQGGDFEALLGMQAASTLTLQRVPGGAVAVVGQERWVDKALVGAVGMFFFWPLMFTAGAGALRQSGLENQLFAALETSVRRQYATVQVGEVPPHILEQMRQQAPQGAPWQQGPSWQQSAPAGQGGRQGWQGWQGFNPFAQQQPQQPRGIQCASCREWNDDGDLYCSHCGKSLVAEKKHCPKCDAEIKANAAFCTKCGADLREEQPSTAQSEG